MSNTFTTTYMSLTLPTVGQDPGPDWAQNVNSAFLGIDAHTHNPGSGRQITPNGLVISSDLSFLVNNATNLRSARFTINPSVLLGAQDLSCVYVVADNMDVSDLYFNDGSGNKVRITQNGAVAGSPGSISGLVSPASASYSSLSKTFIWQSDANTPANMDFASAIFRNLAVNSFGMTVNPPAAMGADTSITFPTVPGSTSFMRMDSFGQMAADVIPDPATFQIAGGLLQVKSGGITSDQLSINNVTNNQTPGGQSTNSTTPVNVPSFNTTIVTTGGPVLVGITSSVAGQLFLDMINNSSPPSVGASIYIKRDGIIIASYLWSFSTSEANNDFAVSPNINHFDDTVTAGSHLYQIMFSVTDAATTATLFNGRIFAYEL